MIRGDVHGGSGRHVRDPRRLERERRTPRRGRQDARGSSGETAYRFYLTNLILAETYGLINVRLGDHHARSWLSSNHLPVVCVTPDDEKFAEELLLGRQDKTYSYVDAASFAVMEKRDTSIAFEFDEHFEQYGWQRLTHIL